MIKILKENDLYFSTKSYKMNLQMAITSILKYMLREKTGYYKSQKRNNTGVNSFCIRNEEVGL